ncbi:MAG TPA: hypothetical protein VI932_03210, partial [Bacteroidota bacterium]|nr:hypothetical protein [Bacteroidota bacterium]
MKSFKLVFILALLACFVAATALAGVAGGVKGANTVQGQGRASAVYDKTASDIPADRAQKFSAPIRVDAALASPQPEQINAMALLKYPTVSAAGLSGTYTIPGDFPDLVSAAAVLNFVGLSGDATFELTSTSYASGTVNIGGAYPGAGTYSLTITVTLGNDVTYDFTTTATNGKGIVLNGAKNVTIDGVGDDTTSLTLAIASYAPFPLGDAFGSTIYITGGSDEIAVKNATVSGVVNDPVWEDQTEGRSCVFIWADDADPGANTDLEFDNVTMINGTIGIKGFAGDFYNSVEGLTVNDCNFGGAFGGRLIIGSWIEWSANVTWTNNEFKDLYWLDWYWNNVGTEFVEDNVFGVGNIYYNLGQMTAWHHLVVANGTYAYNVVDGLSGDVSAGTISYGTRTLGASTATAPVLHHNRFQNIFLDHAGQSLVVIRGGAINVHHNSVRLTGTKTISTTWTSNCLNGVVAAYNNAFSNEMLGGLASTRRGVQAGGTIDYNAIYSSGVPAVGQTTVGGAVAAGINTNGLYGPVNFSADLHIDTATVSAAREIGKPGVLLANDIDGTPIDTTIAGKRDAGADQFSPLSAILTADVLPAAITNPPASGIPTGVPQIPVVRVKNNSQTGATFSVSLTITPDGYSDTKPITLGPNAVGNVSFASWTPVGAGPRTVTATTLLGGDTNPANDIISRAQPVSATVVPPPVYTFDASAEGWEATTGPGAVTDWKRKTSFSKLGGVYGGAGASWVTERPDNPATYTEAGNANAHGYASTFPGPNLLTTPWLDLSGMAGTDLYISFSHSIETEPLWDRAWLQYTVDGITWTDLGVLNDPNGINWYDESLYEHAALDPANWDDGTAQT